MPCRGCRSHVAIVLFITLFAMGTPVMAETKPASRLSPAQAPILVPAMWEYTAPLIRSTPGSADDPQTMHIDKDPSVVFHDGRWHVFMTVKLHDRTVTEYCSFTAWDQADAAPRTILNLSDSRYYCAPQVFYFTPHRKWYLVCQVGMPGTKKMWVACSTTDDIADPASWTPATPILDGGDDDPRSEGGLDYWIICDDQRAYLFFTSLNGKLWRCWTRLEDFPRGFGHCEVALEAEIYEASHTYRLKGRGKYLTLVEQDHRRHYKAYLADRLDGPWTPLADTEQRPFAGAANIRPAPGVEPWTDNISHGELLRDGVDEQLIVDPNNLRFLFQGMFEKDKAGLGYGQYLWHLGLLTPTSD